MPGKVVRMAPRQRKRERTPGEALVDRFLALCSSEDRGKLLFKFLELELADSRKEARIIKRQIIRMVRDKIPKSSHPARHRKNVPKASPEEIMKARTREEAETIENPDYPDCLDDEEDARFDACYCRLSWKRLSEFVRQENPELYGKLDKVIHGMIGGMPDSNDLYYHTDFFEGPEGLYSAYCYLHLMFHGSQQLEDLRPALMKALRKDLPNGKNLTEKGVMKLCLRRLNDRNALIFSVRLISSDSQ